MPVFNLVPVLFSFPVEREISFLEVDGKALYPAFEKMMRKAGKRKELDLLAARFESLALGEPLPPNAIKPIKGRPLLSFSNSNKRSKSNTCIQNPKKNDFITSRRKNTKSLLLGW